MVNYPNKKKNNHYTSMIEGKHNTAHRGMNLEEDINLTNEYYLSHDIAVIHKNLPLFKLSMFLIQKEVQQNSRSLF